MVLPWSGSTGASSTFNGLDPFANCLMGVPKVLSPEDPRRMAVHPVVQYWYVRYLHYWALAVPTIKQPRLLTLASAWMPGTGAGQERYRLAGFPIIMCAVL